VAAEIRNNKLGLDIFRVLIYSPEEGGLPHRSASPHFSLQGIVKRVHSHTQEATPTTVAACIVKNISALFGSLALFRVTVPQWTRCLTGSAAPPVKCLVRVPVTSVTLCLSHRMATTAMQDLARRGPRDTAPNPLI
jgi:hypothetical protein